MQLIDAISPREKETIKHYIQLYAKVAEPAPLSQVLKVWNKQKRTLYKALGNQLRIKIPVEIPRNDLYYKKELSALYAIYPIWDYKDAEWFLNHLDEMKKTIHNSFVFEYLKFIAEADWCDKDKYNASRLIFYQNLEKGYISTVYDENYHFLGFKSTVKNNMKTVRTIQKVLKAMHFPYMSLFEEWRNRISDLNINKDIKANLVISIHPIDFMTMSDNNCDWTSCMSWMTNGSYSAGTIEMMNSNMAVICYLESKSPFQISFDEEYFSIPNKSWRTLLYVHKDILVAGKAYPYFNETLTKCCLTEMRKLLKKNLHWDYQYINQRYKDNSNIKDNFFLKTTLLDNVSRSRNPQKQKRAIYLYTNSMYNDLIEYKDAYWCCRNWVPKTLKLCLSGPVTCMCCGEKIEEPWYINSYDDVGDTKICNNCYIERKCVVCGEIKYQEMPYEFGHDFHVCSKECLKNLIYVPFRNQFYKKEELCSETYFAIGEEGFLNNPQVHEFIEKYRWSYFSKNNVLEELKENNLFKDTVKIIKVPRWIFQNHMFAYYNNSRTFRSDLAGFIRLFEKDETFNSPNFSDKNIFELIKEMSKWVPAEEVINENSSSVFIK